MNNAEKKHLYEICVCNLQLYFAPTVHYPTNIIGYNVGWKGISPNRIYNTLELAYNLHIDAFFVLKVDLSVTYIIG